MEHQCFIAGCDSISGGSLALFRTPKDPDMLAKWKRAIPGTLGDHQRYGDLLGPDHRVCEKHFARNAIWRPKAKPSEETTVTKPWLNCDSVPSVFPGYSKGVTKRRGKVRTSTIQGNNEASSKGIMNIETSVAVSKTTPSGAAVAATRTSSRVKAQSQISITAEPDDLTEAEAELAVPVVVESMNSDERLTFDRLWSELELVELPESWAFHRVVHTKSGENGTPVQRLIVFSEAGVSRGRGHLPITTKRLYFGEDLRYEVTVLSMKQKLDLSLDKPTSFSDVDQALRLLAARNVCQGGPWPTVSGPLDPEVAIVDETGLYRHRECHGLMIAGRFRCPPCRRLLQAHRTKPSSPATSSPKHLKLIARLRMKLKTNRAKMQRMKEVPSLEDQLRRTDLLPDQQRAVVEEMLSVAKTASDEGKRYSVDWMRTCLMLCACSTPAYKFLRRRNILPLPSIRSLVEYGAGANEEVPAAVADGAEEESGCAEEVTGYAEGDPGCAEEEPGCAEDEPGCVEDGGGGGEVEAANSAAADLEMDLDFMEELNGCEDEVLTV